MDWAPLRSYGPFTDHSQEGTETMPRKKATESPLVIDESSSRLLPWTTDMGNPVRLVTDDPEGLLSRVADHVEVTQTAMAERLLKDAGKMLADPLSTRAEVAYVGVRLMECLADVLRVSESRRLRLADVPASEKPRPRGKSTARPKGGTAARPTGGSS